MDVEVSQDCHNDIMINSALVKISVYKVKDEDKVVVHRAARQATKLIMVYVPAIVGPDPLDEEPLFRAECVCCPWLLA